MLFYCIFFINVRNQQNYSCYRNIIKGKHVVSISKNYYKSSINQKIGLISIFDLVYKSAKVNLKRFSFLLFILYSLFYATIVEASDTIYIKENQSPFKIDGEFLVKIGEVLLIEAGSVIEVEKGGLIAGMGSIIARGSESQPIILRRLDDEWRIIRMLREADSLVLNHVQIENGSIYSLECDVRYFKCQFKNSRSLEWNQSISSNHGGSLLIDSCTIIGNDSGEGFLCHNMKGPVIKNCVIEQTPDGVELIECTDGLISGNDISNASDDAIDLNSCQRVMITDNTISHISNRGLEIGHTSRGPSFDIEISNNNISHTHTGIHLMQKTEASINNNSFSDNTQNILLTELENKTSPETVTITDNKVDSTDTYIVTDTMSYYHSVNNISNSSIAKKINHSRILFFAAFAFLSILAIYFIKRNYIK
jgi:hypothetical protein